MLETAIFGAVTRAARFLPYEGGAQFAEWIALHQGERFAKRGRVLRKNLAPFVNDPVRLTEAVRAGLRSSGRFFFEFFRGPENADIQFRIEGAEILDHALARGRGVVLALPHQGNWEIAACRLAARGTKVTSVAGIQLLAGWTRPIRESRAAHGLTIVSPDRAGLRLLDEALARGEIVALHVDGDQFRRGIPVSIAGKQVEFPVGPAKLAARHGAPLVFGACRRESSRVHVGRVIREFAPFGGDPESIQGITRQLAALFEDSIRAAPGEWTMFRPFFEARSTPTSPLAAPEDSKQSSAAAESKSSRPTEVGAA